MGTKAMKVFEVTITETLEMKVLIDAASTYEAEKLVQENWDDSKYILDADHFTGASFNAKMKSANEQS